jgi:hypothetical protein
MHLQLLERIVQREFPWDYHPDLTADRLIRVAQCIVKGRNDALDRHNAAIGDTGWTLGCSAFQFACFRLLEVMDSGDYPWLVPVDRSLQFIFKIGAIAVRFYRGEADDPHVRTLRRTYPELIQFRLAFPDDEGRDLLYRFAVETDFDGSISAIKFVGLRDESPVFCWEVPYEAGVGRMPRVVEPPAEGIELPPPPVKLPGEDNEKEGNEKEDGAA